MRINKNNSVRDDRKTCVLRTSYTQHTLIIIHTYVLITRTHTAIFLVLFFCNSLLFSFWLEQLFTNEHHSQKFNMRLLFRYKTKINMHNMQIKNDRFHSDVQSIKRIVSSFSSCDKLFAAAVLLQRVDFHRTSTLTHYFHSTGALTSQVTVFAAPSTLNG